MAVRRVLVGVSMLVLAVAVAIPQAGARTGAATRSGLPDGVPPAATWPEPRLPEPSAWPFSGDFPKTSGTGRLDRGASLWTDFVYDDHGASTVGSLPLELAGGLTRGLAPAQGVYSYRDPAAKNNGADIFRAGVALGAKATHWRVDWTTLADADVPIAAWTFDRDSSAATGVAQWPASAGVTSSGIDTALVVSSRGARLLDLVTGAVRARLPVTVDRASKSFVVAVPRSVLPVSGSWRIRLAAGVADADGTGFAAPAAPLGAPVRVYNVAFRSVRQEPAVHTGGSTAALVAQAQKSAVLVDRFGLDGLGRAITGNFWNEDNQADTLATGDVSAFSRVVDWSALAAGTVTPEPAPVGYSVRWYVSRLDLGEGVAAQANPAGDLRPNYLSRVQPYVVYVPSSYRRDTATPLTWVLHSLGVNHNQYAALNPRLLEQVCEERGSICATTLGRGPDGWYYDEAEVDYWQVWHALAAAYTLDPERTVMSGYSMGGWASYKLTLEHPDLYAAAMPLAGTAQCGSQLGPNGSPSLFPPTGHCRDEGDYTTMLGNARWVPYVIGHGALDELIPAVGVVDHVRALDELGYRYEFFLYPGEDHLVWAMQDRFDSVVAALPASARVRDPGHVTYSWYPDLTRSDYGLGATGAYWVGGLRARSSGPGQVASVQARSLARPDRAVDVRRSGPSVAVSPLPAGRYGLTWAPGARPAARPEVVLDVANVRALSVDTARAGLRCGTVRVTTDGPVSLMLAALAPRSEVTVAGRRTTADAGGTATVSLPGAGSHEVVVRCR